MKYSLILITSLLFICCSSDSEMKAETPQSNSTMTININIDGTTQNVTLANNVATQALIAKLQEGPVTISLNSNGDFEIWGSLGFSLPRADEWFEAQPGDVVLYSGSNICIFYGQNSYSYTPLGKIKGLSTDALKSFLKSGQSNISVTLSMPDTSGIGLVEELDKEDFYYSLNGQRVEHPTKGIYIKRSAEDRLQGKNGKTVIL